MLEMCWKGDKPERSLPSSRRRLESHHHLSGLSEDVQSGVFAGCQLQGMRAFAAYNSHIICIRRSKTVTTIGVIVLYTAMP